MKNPSVKNKEPFDVLYRIQRGLSAYVSYLAACEMNQAFSEYVLYEPILRILTARGYKVVCEYACPGIVHAAVGDKKRIDFLIDGHNIKIAMEVKWAQSNRINIKSDEEKLNAFLAQNPDAFSLLCVFGRKSHIEKVNSNKNFVECGKLVFAELQRTRYGCRIFQLKTEIS